MALVILYHMPDAGGRPSVAFPGAFIGVDIFFVLSGFLITTMLLERRHLTGHISYVRFWRDRLYRLLPALMPLLVFTSGALLVLKRESLSRVLYSDAAVLTYTANWATVVDRPVASVLGHCWSLAVEGQFYAVWPLIVIVALRRRVTPRGGAVLLGLAIAACAIWRAYLWQRSGAYSEVFPRTDVRADAFLIGAMASTLWRSGVLRPTPMHRWAPASLALLAAISLTVSIRDATMYLGGYTLVAVASAILLIGCLETDWWLGRATGSPVLVYLGAISYGIYLWHVPAMVFAASLTVPPILGAVGAVVGAVIVASLSWRYLEQPALAFRDRARRPGADAAPAEPANPPALGQPQ